MPEGYPDHLGQFRIALTDGEGTTFQWRSPFTDRESAEAALPNAAEEFPGDEYSAPVVQELFSNGEDGDDAAAKWFEVE
jgi:hypothetical protein